MSVMSLDAQVLGHFMLDCENIPLFLQVWSEY